MLQLRGGPSAHWLEAEGQEWWVLPWSDVERRSPCRLVCAPSSGLCPQAAVPPWCGESGESGLGWSVMCLGGVWWSVVECVVSSPLALVLLSPSLALLCAHVRVRVRESESERS